MVAKKNKKVMRAVFLMDESGSMSDCIKETVTGYNEFLNSLRIDKGDKVIVSLVKFDSENINDVYLNKDIKDVVDMGMNEFKPRASTPLLDAIGLTIRKTEKHFNEGDACVFIILTDGMENASREFNKSTIKALLDEKRKDNWKFVFLGADIDAFAEGRKFGISSDDTLGFGKRSMNTAYTKMSDSLSGMRMSNNAGFTLSASGAFTEQDQKDVSK